MKTNTFPLTRRLAGNACVALALLCTAVSAYAERPLLKYKDEITLKAPPQKAWDTFKDFDSIHKWHPATENTVLLVGQNGKPLAVREFQIKGAGAFVISELLAYDERKRWFKYRIIKTNLPLSNYVGEMWVVPAPHGGSVVKWTGQFQRPEETPKPDQDDAATIRLVQGVFKAGLDNIVSLTSK
ncbi:SRPBCC family protein [Curvibacter sp. CHRR-16]|uniref:SRPBCC family protein n=1 Tax=Curvibacter sp. CHRR-16 TaxID=2835872 RepID=UPI001BD98F59|nr:SRPBCC family protein [Curvibacter sp. CHRR-16]MBT0570529.1 SRPBCC family protein [Curvibacter sp. CHRR-16]